MNNPAQQARMKHVLHQYTGSGVAGYKRASGKPRVSTSINNVPPLYLDDGTWVIKYSVQAPGTVGFRDQNYNRKMLNCMECDVPAGVIFATEVGYKVLGLAFVERFEPENGWFVLHGPVHKGGPGPRFAPDMSYLKHIPVDIEFAGQGATDDEIWLWHSLTIVLFDRIAWRCNLAPARRCMLFLICIARGERV